MLRLRTVFVFFLFLSALPVVRAQNAIFISQGKIEFEKRVNQYSQLNDDNNDSWNELRKKTMNKFKTTYFDLLFNGNKSLYRPGREVVEKGGQFFWEQPAQDNV